jgi:hypothetical protein
VSDTEKLLADLSKRVDDLVSKGMDRRMTDLVTEGIGKWERSRGTLALVILGIVGLASYSELNHKIVEHFASSVVKQIDNEVKTKTASISVQDPLIAELKTRTDELEKRVAQIGKSAPPSAAPLVTSGFAFFGIRDPDGSWPERHFRITAGGDRVPRINDEVEALGSVNVRSGYIVYGPKGWTNQRATGILLRGEKIKVVDAKEVVEGFWWINFVRWKEASE